MKRKKVSLAGIFLVVAAIVIVVMGCVMYMNYSKIAELTIKVNSQENKSEASELLKSENNNQTSELNVDYVNNFNKSVFEKLGKDGEIVIPIWAYSNFSEITINSDHEAYWNNIGNDTFPETSNTKVAEDVVNAWYCPLGQDIESNACILFLKENGNVTYIRFYIDKDKNEKEFVNCTEEKELEGISNISNIIVVENGFYGAIFVKEDGTCIDMELYELEDLTEENEEKEDIED